MMKPSIGRIVHYVDGERHMPAVIGAVFSSAPDLEHVVPHPGHDLPKLFPSHRLDGWHRSGGISAPLQLAAALVIVGVLVLRKKER